MTKTAYFGLRLPKDLEGEVDHIPLIYTQPVAATHPFLRRALKEMAQFSHIVFTSRTSVELLVDHFKVQLEVLQASKILAVGPGTASTCAEYGLTVEATAELSTAEGLRSLLKSLNLSKAYVLWPHSAQARPIIQDYLLKHGIAHIACPLYRTDPIIYDPIPVLDSYTQLVFTSPSTVSAFLRNFGHPPDKARSTAIGPVTERALKKEWIKEQKHKSKKSISIEKKIFN